MKKIKNKGLTYRFLFYWRGLRISVLFFLFFNYCEAQNTQQLLMQTSVNKKLSGLYSSKKLSDFPEKKRSDSTDHLPSSFPVNKQNYKEKIDKRTYTSRTFNNNQGEVVIQYCSKNLNYLDRKNKFHPINTNLFATSPITLHVKGEEERKSEWAALQQQYPTFLFKDGSTALSSDEKNKITFNLNCKINGHEINYSDYTVGEHGMFINNVIAGIDKKIIFDENTIETDYIIRQKINIDDQDLIISEEIELPDGYTISPVASPLGKRELSGEVFAVHSSEGIEKARFRVPFFYDANKIILVGKYNLIQQAGKIILQIIVPEQWLNDENRRYPVTIDPVVTGPTSIYPLLNMNSCAMPSYATDSMLITIPGGITITSFNVQDNYFATPSSSPPALMRYGHMYLTTSCGSTPVYTIPPAIPPAVDSSGEAYLDFLDLKNYLACCFPPSCSAQTFYLHNFLGRDNYGPGCNEDYIFYSQYSPHPLSAYVVGKTVETAQAQWSVFPTTVCSDSCTIFLKVNTNYGVPPYTITHPWASGSYQYGSSPDGCTGIGSDTIALTIPGCPTTCGTTPALSIPAPFIIDVCGDSVTGLSAKSITIKPVPVATAGPVSVCSGSPFNIPVSSCVTGSSFIWTGSNGTGGTGNINDNVLNTGPSAITINYSVIPTASGCIGQPINVSAEIDTLPVINGGLNDTIEPGISTQLNATGGLTYLWTPTSGLSCADCADPLATPVITTTYYVIGTNESGCSSGDTIEISVTQGSEVLYIPNSFSPNDNKLNDLFYAYGTSIKIFDLQIYDRWGELIFRTNDIKQGWDGKYRGKMVEGGVYVYAVSCEWLSGVEAYRNGIVTILR